MEALRDQIERWVGREEPCSCPDGIHRVPTKRVLIEEGAIERLPEVIEQLRLPRTALVVVDDNTLAAAGEQVLRVLSAGGIRTTVLNLGSEADVEDSYVKRVARALDGQAGSCMPVAVGAGTINDVVKMASEEAYVPYVACATAPSMNGYPSSISAIFRRGVKRTLPAAPPVAIVADLAVMCGAPTELIASGFADLLSKPLCNSDWWLAHRLHGEPYCELPASIMLDAAERLQDNGEAVRRRQPEAIELLTGALILSGFAMAAAGHSRPASGAEHLVSHYWDMIGHRDGLKTDRHGRQVGVGSLLALNVWHRVLAVPAEQVRAAPEAERPSLAHHLLEVRRVYGSLSAYVEEEFGRKYLSPAEHTAFLGRLAECWDDLRAELHAALPSVREHRRRLEAAGAPTTPEDIGRTKREARDAVRFSRYMRARYTVLDLAADLGVLEEE